MCQKVLLSMGRVFQLLQDQMHMIRTGKMDPVVHLESQKASVLKIPEYVRQPRQLDLIKHEIFQYFDDTLINAPNEELFLKKS